MFVRKKRNRSGTTSVSVVFKRAGSFKEVHHVGSSADPDEIQRMYNEGCEWIARYGGQQLIDFDEKRRAEQVLAMETAHTIAGVRDALSLVERTTLDAPQTILNRVYDRIGFNAIEDKILRHLVIARVCQPMSKTATVEYLKSYFDEDVHLYDIYRYMDKLHNTQQEKIQQISVSHTMGVLGGCIGLMFYDVTTLYFESAPDPSDELRQDGFSKDGKTAESQIVLGLLVSQDGYPLSYSVFNGKQYEGYTMIPIIDDFVQRFNLTDFIVVADSGLMSETSVSLLESAGYKYILGARIRSESPKTKDWLLGIDHVDGHCAEYEKRAGQRLIVSYSESRAKKNAHNREKGVARLQKAYAKGTLTKDKVNKRGYNKFLDISKDITVRINYEKIEEDARWDGLKGYITNTDLAPAEVIRQYQGLWVVERAFRIGKSNLEMRPMFHFTPKRIEAHICICFVAYKVYKELERTIRELGIGMSVDKVLFYAKTIPTIRFRLPNGDAYTERLYTMPQQEKIRPLLEG